MIKRSPILAAIAVLAAATLTPAPASADSRFKCVKDWAAASQIVAREKLAGVASLSDAARAVGNDRIVKSTLCRVDGAFVYRVVLRDKRGRLKTETVNARKPFGQTPKRR
ncbi:MAG: hypothetical protein AAFQ45_10165 [Pseudomonadota bacterium]